MSEQDKPAKTSASIRDLIGTFLFALGMSLAAMGMGLITDKKVQRDILSAFEKARKEAME